jgi:tetratricopeptide (TPR) repeat protein
MGSKRRSEGGRKRPQPGSGARAMSGPQNLRFQKAVQAHIAGDLALAESVYRTLLSEKVRQPQLFNNLALVCMQSGREREAMNLLEKAVKLAPRYPDARMHLAALYERQGRADQALECYQGLLSKHPEMYVARYLAANLLKARGRMEEAKVQYLEVLARKPDYTQAHFTYSGLHRYEDADDPHLAGMLALYESGTLETDGRIQLAFALAKAHEDLGDFAGAFRYLETGNGLRYRKYQYDIEGDRALFENIMDTFSVDAVRSLQVSGQTSKRPVFIVGMPRSGTTLVERILASHSDVYAGGELDYLYALGVARFLRVSGRVQFQPLGSYPEEAWVSLGRDYVEMIGRLDGDAARVTDKLPMNFMMIGLIRCALPNAKIVHCVRDPRATCLSIFKQNFSSENYRFAYDLRTVAQFHTLYRRLMDHWRRVFPGAIHDVEYEALTSEPERQIRELLSACDLELQASCLDFHRSRGVIRTASYNQARQPIYESSVDLWRRYEEFLGPLLDELALEDS